MSIDSIEAFTLRIPFKTGFKHASAERSSTQTIWVDTQLGGGTHGCGEGCPREYVTSESVESACGFIAAHRDEWQQSLSSFAAVCDWVATHDREIDAHPAAWTAVELSILDALGKSSRRSVESLLGLPDLAGRYQYTAVLGDALPQAFHAQLSHYVKAGFRQFKIKLSGDLERDRAKVESLAAFGISPTQVRADANNLWRDHAGAILALKTLGFPFFALEEPLAAGDFDGMREISQALEARIILDESALRAGQLRPLAADAHRWIVNIRVSKMGGLLRALGVLREANSLGLGIIVGAHVGETSVLTRAALTVAASATRRLVAQEGAFGTHLLQRDVVEYPIMFGTGGMLDADALGLSGSSGLGLAIARDLPLEPAQRPSK